MSWQAKKFWKEVSVVPEGDGFTVALDGRAIKTPSKAPLILPTKALAEAVAEEWRAVDEVIQPDAMPVTRAANSALDKVAVQRGAVIDMLASYGETDLLCHRADSPEGLVERQEAGWDPMLLWAREALQAPLVATVGIMPAKQPATSLEQIRAAIAEHDDFALTALHDLIMLSGSAVLGLAVAHGQITADDAWALSLIDEHWQEEQWGEDAEAKALENTKKESFFAADRFLKMTRAS
ncbi:ATP12 family chaperone protein [Paracoccaceae bacterium GXU_MW_L88]